jgi:hypothetical protein
MHQVVPLFIFCKATSLISGAAYLGILERRDSMEDIRDCSGHLMCRGDARTGFVSSLYKGHRTTAHLAVGETFTVERNDTKTEITRIDDSTFKVKSFQKAV